MNARKEALYGFTCLAGLLIALVMVFEAITAVVQP